MGKRPLKKASTTPQADPLVITVPPMVPIREHQPELESDSSDSELSLQSSRAGSLDEDIGDEDEEDVPKPPRPPPTVGKRKRGRPSKASKPRPMDSESENPIAKIMYMTTILSAAEAKKAISKRVPVNESFELSTEEPWDTVKARLLVKIDNALSPKKLDYQHYHVMFFVPKSGLAKPGLTLSSEEHYNTLLARVQASNNAIPTVNITIQEKENMAENWWLRGNNLDGVVRSA